MGKAADDEPVFVLRAHDRVSVFAIKEWTHAAFVHGVSEDKLQRAADDMAEFLVWREKHGTKLPD